MWRLAPYSGFIQHLPTGDSSEEGLPINRLVILICRNNRGRFFPLVFPALGRLCCCVIMTSLPFCAITASLGNNLYHPFDAGPPNQHAPILPKCLQILSETWAPPKSSTAEALGKTALAERTVGSIYA